MKVYKIKKDLTKEQLEAAGFHSKEVDGETFFICFVPQGLDSDLVKSSLDIYNSDKFKNTYYIGEGKKKLKKELGLEYGKDNKVKMTEKMLQVLTMWRVEFMASDRLLVLRSLDPFDSTCFCNPKMLQDYCGTLIDELKEKDLIEEVEEKFN